MQHALRPYVTCGVALVGASLIAVTSAPQPSTGIHHVYVPAIQLMSNDQLLLDLSPEASAAAALPASVPNYDQEIAAYDSYFNNFLTADPSEYNAFDTLLNNYDYPGTIGSCLTGGCVINLSDPAVGPALQQVLGEYQLIEANYETVPYYDPTLDAQLRDSITELQTYLTITGVGSTTTPPPDVPPTDSGLSTDVTQLEELFLGGQNPGDIHTPLDFFNALEQGFVDGLGLQSALTDPISEGNPVLTALGVAQTGSEIAEHQSGALSGNLVDVLHEYLEVPQFALSSVGGVGEAAVLVDPELALNPYVDGVTVVTLIAAPVFGLADNALSTFFPG
jgi:hypothetical protein